MKGHNLIQVIRLYSQVVREAAPSHVYILNVIPIVKKSISVSKVFEVQVLWRSWKYDIQWTQDDFGKKSNLIDGKQIQAKLS